MSDDLSSPFDRLASFYLEVPGVTRGSMMGHPCLKIDKTLFASSQHDGDAVILKLPAEHVAALIAAGDGTPFSPGKKPFAKWVRLEGIGWDRLITLADEAFEGARTGTTA